MDILNILKKHGATDLLQVSFVKDNGALHVLFSAQNNIAEDSLKQEILNSVGIIREVHCYPVHPEEDYLGVLRYFFRFRPELFSELTHSLQMISPKELHCRTTLKPLLELSEELEIFLRGLNLGLSLRLEEALDEALLAIEASKQQALKQIFWTEKTSSPKEVTVKNEYGKTLRKTIAQILGDEDYSRVQLSAEIFDLEKKTLRSGKLLIQGTLFDGIKSLGFKCFPREKDALELEKLLKNSQWYEIKGTPEYDTFLQEKILRASAFKPIAGPGRREDTAMTRRSEFSVLTNMSETDGITPVADYIRAAKEWGMPAIAITDHSGVHSFPDAMKAKGDYEGNILFGLNIPIYDDTYPLIPDSITEPFQGEFVVFDLETTGFNPRNCEIIEIGAVRIKNFEVVDTFQELIKPRQPIPVHITELTGIRNEDVRNAKPIEEVLPAFERFIGRTTLVAHNIDFDYPFLSTWFKNLGSVLTNEKLDTLDLARLLVTKLKRHRLDQLARYFKINQEHHHRAMDDALVAARIFIQLMYDLRSRGIESFQEVKTLESDAFYRLARFKKNVTLIASDQDGIIELYDNLSEAALHHLESGKPSLPKTFLKQHRSHLHVLSSDGFGEVFEAITRGRSDDEIKTVMTFYDVIEVQPFSVNAFFLKNHTLSSEAEYQQIVRQIVDLASEAGIPVIATSHARYLEPSESLYRNIIREGQKRNLSIEDGGLFLRTTAEMLEEMSFLGEQTCRQIVIDNPNRIAASIGQLQPVPKGKFPPVIEGSDKELRETCYSRARSQYGDPLPPAIEERLEYELSSIINNGFAVLYITAEMLVRESERKGYLVGSRGSVGSSFAATMGGITEVNPLPAHYYCPACHFVEFSDDERFANGFDLPDKDCPNCRKPLKKDGFNIPFEVFMGFKGDKEPDIDLNFSPVVQSEIHKYTEQIFGSEQVYKVGTVGTIAEKTAYGYALKYFEEKQEPFSKRDVSRVVTHLTGVKRSTGQHPGGLIVVPKGHKITEFTPVQYPANDEASGIITTHFDYHGALEGKLFKLDILGHEVPSIIHDLEAMTGVDASHARFDDPRVLSIFNSVKELGIQDPAYRQSKGTLGIPEYGTSFVRQMLEDTNPQNLEDLIRISGLSHGTNVWLGNAQDLIKQDGLSIKDVIATRDQIMLYLIQMGLDNSTAFQTMELVRKGRKLSEEQNETLREHGVPEWFIESCKKISYLFPKAHAVAYVLMSFRIAFYKVYYPLAFYASYFSTHVDDFDYALICNGVEKVRYHMDLISQNKEASKKEQDAFGVLEVAEEFYSRGLRFAPLSLTNSDALKFKIYGECLLPPFRSISGLGEAAAEGIVRSRQEGAFLSIEDLSSRARLNQKNVESLRELGCLDGFSETNQLDLFDLL